MLLFNPCQVEMKKSATAGTHFNARVVECRLAAKVSYNRQSLTHLAKTSTHQFSKLISIHFLKTLVERI